MRNNSPSEIFDNYIRIAQEKDLISPDAPDKAKKKLEENPRADSLDISTIEALYGKKPNTPKNMEYKSNIVEDAHPSPVVLTTSYDRLNSLIENVNERQNIILNIVNKTPDGQLTQYKNAKKDLILSLVRVGNALDNSHKDNLRKLSDTCLYQMSLKKQAALPYLGIAAGIGAVLGATYLYEHFTSDEGFRENSKKLIDMINLMLAEKDSAENFLGFGEEYSKYFLDQLSSLGTKVDNILYDYNQAVSQCNLISSKVNKGKDAIELAKTEKSKLSQLLQTFKNSFEAEKSELDNLHSNLSNEAYQLHNVENKGWGRKLLEKVPGLLGGGKANFFTNKFFELNNLIQNYLESYKKELEYFNKALDIQQQTTTRIEQKIEETKPSEKKQNTTIPTQTTKTDDEKIREELARNYESELEGLE